MAFNDVEISEFFEPQELYTISRGLQSWHYTSGDVNINFGGNTFVATPIKRSSINSTQELNKTNLKISMSRRVTFLGQFIPGSPTDIFTITVTRIHASDPDPAIIFKGRIINVKFAESSAELTCVPLQVTLKRPGLRRVYQTTCPHVLYGDQCKLNRFDFSVTTNLTGVSGLTISSPDFVISIDPIFDPTHFIGGFVEWTVGGLVETRFIIDHDNVSGILTLNRPFLGMDVGVSVTAFAGCGRGVSVCSNKFNNIVNYGGFPFIPTKNPMDGTPVF